MDCSDIRAALDIHVSVKFKHYFLGVSWWEKTMQHGMKDQAKGKKFYAKLEYAYWHIFSPY
jgi:hypothetical protein